MTQGKTFLSVCLVTPTAWAAAQILVAKKVHIVLRPLYPSHHSPHISNIFDSNMGISSLWDVNFLTATIYNVMLKHSIPDTWPHKIPSWSHQVYNRLLEVGQWCRPDHREVDNSEAWGRHGVHCDYFCCYYLIWQVQDRTCMAECNTGVKAAGVNSQCISSSSTLLNSSRFLSPFFLSSTDLHTCLSNVATASSGISLFGGRTMQLI